MRGWLNRWRGPWRARLPLLFALPVVMFGFGYLMVPIYEVFCDITGLNGKTGRLSDNQAEYLAVDAERWITVEFVAVTNQNAAWEFAPEQAFMRVRPGQTYAMTYRAVNQLNQPAVAQAVPSVAPGKAAAHFKKISCFCFNQQPFDALENKQMPLVFVVEPDLPGEVDTVTLAYTLFDASAFIN